jgi:PBP1b-binding outer membrane lipoprotein LpoB
LKSKKLIVFLIMILLISGCRGNGNKKQEIKTLDKAPDSLTDIDKGISAILEKVGRIERII